MVGMCCTRSLDLAKAEIAPVVDPQTDCHWVGSPVGNFAVGNLSA